MAEQVILPAFQPGLFKDMPAPKKNAKNAEWGTFKDSLRAPVHRWFTYPAGFSYKAVEHSMARYGVTAGQTIYDPFMGSGTTNVVAKTHGVHSYGVEAHPFVYRIAKTKLNWDVDLRDVLAFIKLVRQKLPVLSQEIKESDDWLLEDVFPELVLKCYESKTLVDLLALRTLVLEEELEVGVRDFFFVVVTALLREVSTAATGWPYIAPKKQKTTSIDKDVFTEFSNLSRRMIDDIAKIREISQGRFEGSTHWLHNDDSRNTVNFIPDGVVDHVFTSPPYLNNFDYADRTRLELYYWGEAKTWGDISKNIREKLMTSATTQIARSDPKYKISQELQTECPEVADFIADAVAKLSELRKTKGGKKSYDLLITGYFNDIHQIVRDVYRVLKPGTKALFVLGDSAPYGVHVPTDELIGKIGVCAGFCNYDIEILRTRGDKWKKNPQRHSIPLRESIVILSKD
ncbi:MAG: site-specific DNA-methyltransferase [Chloroflexi bacterium]|nr:site-specific DNA-methyltransferase [Chloroflexota bacterium]